MKRALIVGVSGQDGAYLARLLLDKGYDVYGTSRSAADLSRLIALGVMDSVKLHALLPTDLRQVLYVVRNVEPHEIYNLAGQSSVAESFIKPAETVESIVLGTLNLLEAVRCSGQPIRFYNAGSSEIFGDTLFATEQKAFRPKSPYGVAKAAAVTMVANYRAVYGLFACSGIMFNHESPLRPEQFVSRKIVTTAVRIAHGSQERLRLGNLSLRRDWGWAPDYVKAMWLMLNCEQPDDYVIATGKPTSLLDFTRQTFEAVGLDWQAHVDSNPTLTRAHDIEVSCGDAGKAKRLLGWEPTVIFPEIVKRLTQSELEKTGAGSAVGPVPVRFRVSG